MRDADEVTTGFVTWQGRKTWYEQQGEDGVPLVLLAGGPGSSGGYFAPLAERLARQGRRVIRYSPVGTGQSDRERPAEGWTVRLFLDELQAVRDKLSLEWVDLLGHSWGGWLALEHILGGAAGVRSLILYSSSASAPHTNREIRRLVEALPEPTRQIILDHEANGTFDSDSYRRANMEFLRRHFCRLDPWPEALSYTGFGEDLYVSMWGPSEFTCTGTLADWDVTARLGEVTIPTLILSGAHDEVTLPLQEELRRGIPHAHRITFADSAHMAHLEEPERFDAALLELLAKMDVGGDSEAV